MDPAQEGAMRNAFAEWYRLVGALPGAENNAHNDTHARQLIDRAKKVSALWESGPDGRAWEWLVEVTQDWELMPDRLREITDNARHDLQVGQTAFTALEYRSMDQAGTLVDPVYRQEKQWRAEHLTLAAEQALDARLHTAGTTSDLVADVAAAKGAAWDAVWGDHTGQWSPERREWEATYAMDGVNRDEERAIYFSVYAAERHRLEHPEMNEAAEVAVDMARHGARISRLLDTATPAADPAPAPPVDDLVKRDFTAPAPDRIWLTDISEHPTDEGKLYLCAVKDLWSNRIVGYSIDSRMKASLACAALRNAIALRDPQGTIVHSDRGSQFRSNKYVKLLSDNNLRGSMGRVGAAGDNAAMESFFGLLHNNILDRKRWATREELRLAIVFWIERTYHRRRHQRGLARMTPVEYETLNQASLAA